MFVSSGISLDRNAIYKYFSKHHPVFQDQVTATGACKTINFEEF